MLPKIESRQSETSFAPSTLLGLDCVPYWTDLCGEISSKLWLPVAGSSPEKDLNLSKNWLNQTMDSSWFSTNMSQVPHPNWCQIFSPSSISSLVESTDGENTIKKSKKLRIYLNAEQRIKIRQWIGTARFVYNKTVEDLQQSGTKANWQKIKGGILKSLPDWSKYTIIKLNLLRFEMPVLR